MRETETLAISDPEQPEPENSLEADDKRILSFYSGQIITHSAHLTHAIDAFLQTVEHNQPPKVFLAHSKFVVLSAHWLVQVGDTVHRNLVGCLYYLFPGLYFLKSSSLIKFSSFNRHM